MENLRIDSQGVQPFIATSTQIRMELRSKDSSEASSISSKESCLSSMWHSITAFIVSAWNLLTGWCCGAKAEKSTESNSEIEEKLFASEEQAAVFFESYAKGFIEAQFKWLKETFFSIEKGAGLLCMQLR